MSRKTTKYSDADLFSARGSRRRVQTSGILDGIDTIRRVTIYNYLRYVAEYEKEQIRLQNDIEALKDLERRMIMIIPSNRITSRSTLPDEQILQIRRRILRGFCSYGIKSLRETVRIRDETLLQQLRETVTDDTK